MWLSWSFPKISNSTLTSSCHCGFPSTCTTRHCYDNLCISSCRNRGLSSFKGCGPSGISLWCVFRRLRYSGVCKVWRWWKEIATSKLARLRMVAPRSIVLCRSSCWPTSWTDSNTACIFHSFKVCRVAKSPAYTTWPQEAYKAAEPTAKWARYPEATTHEYAWLKTQKYNASTRNSYIAASLHA